MYIHIYGRCKSDHVYRLPSLISQDPLHDRSCWEKPRKPSSEECVPQRKNALIWMSLIGWWRNSKTGPKLKQQASWWSVTSARPGLPIYGIWNLKINSNWNFYIYFFTCVQPPTRAQEKFISSLEIVVKRRSSQKVIVDEEWLTEKEMKEDYGWSAHFPYSMGFVWTQTTSLKPVSTCIVLTVYMLPILSLSRSALMFPGPRFLERRRLAWKEKRPISGYSIRSCTLIYTTCWNLFSCGQIDMVHTQTYIYMCVFYI